MRGLIVIGVGWLVIVAAMIASILAFQSGSAEASAIGATCADMLIYAGVLWGLATSLVVGRNVFAWWMYTGADTWRYEAGETEKRLD